MSALADIEVVDDAVVGLEQRFGVLYRLRLHHLERGAILAILGIGAVLGALNDIAPCLLYTSPSPRDS